MLCARLPALPHRRRRAAVLLAVAAALAAPAAAQADSAAVPTAAQADAAAAAGSASSVRFGLSAGAQGVTGSQGIARLQLTAATGAKWIREEFQWSVIQPSPGVWDFSRYDALLKNASALGLRVLPVLLAPPRWASPSAITLPADPAAFAEYTRRVVARYGPHGSFWAANPQLRPFAPDTFEVWNEPYFVYSSASGYDPARYVRLLKASVTAGRAADPSARFLLPAENTGRMLGSRWVSWVDELYRVAPDLNAYFDAISVHPYGKDVTGLSSGMSFRQLRRIEQLRWSFALHGAVSKPFWITELGWSTCPANGEWCESEAQQATAMAQALFRIKSTYPWVRAVFIFHAQDYGSNPSAPDQWYGLSRQNGSHKPAWNVFRLFAGVM